MMAVDVLFSSRLCMTAVCMKRFIMSCSNFGERCGTNLQSRLVMSYVGLLAKVGPITVAIGEK
jgi:hypothetical protein